MRKKPNRRGVSLLLQALLVVLIYAVISFFLTPPPKTPKTAKGEPPTKATVITPQPPGHEDDNVDDSHNLPPPSGPPPAPPRSAPSTEPPTSLPTPEGKGKGKEDGDGTGSGGQGANAGGAGGEGKGPFGYSDSDLTHYEQSAMTNLAIKDQMVKAVAEGGWLKPFDLPRYDALNWDAVSAPPRKCERPNSKRPERGYCFNSPLKVLRHFGGLKGFLVHRLPGGHPVPNSINQEPIIYTEGYSTSKEFGPWHAKWVEHPKDFPPTRSQVTMAEADPFVMTFKDVWYFRGNVMECGRYFAPGGCPGITEPISNYSFTGTTQKFGKAVVAICDRHCGGYYHWTHEQLPRLAMMYEFLRNNPDVQIIAPGSPDRNGHIIQTVVGVLGLKSSQLRFLQFQKTVKFDYVYYPQPQRCGSILTPALFLTRKVVFERLGLSSEHTRRKRDEMLVVMADRKDNRQTKNHVEVLAALRKEFPRVRFEGHMFRPNSTSKRGAKEQIDLFNRADMVIGPHGANLANIMWCKFGVTVLEYVFDQSGNLCYYQTASKIGLHYRMIMVKGNQRQHTPNVDIQEVIRHVREVRQTLDP